MRTTYTDALISSVPAGDLILLAAVFSLSALVLFAMAVEAGIYPKTRYFLRRTRSALRELRSDRWQGESLST